MDGRKGDNWMVEEGYSDGRRGDIRMGIIGEDVRHGGCGAVGRGLAACNNLEHDQNLN